MSEPQRSAAPQPPPDGPGPLHTWLESLRSEGAWRLDPARFHYLEALSRRLPGQPDPVRRLLQDKLQAALAEYAERFSQAQQADAAEAARLARELRGAACAPLAQLNQYIRGASPAGVGAAAPDETQERNELASVRRFRRAWASSRTQDQVAQAASRKPANAGPLNSHVLVLRSLALMRGLSPDYLRRFLVHVESLQWLDQAGEKYPRKQGKQTNTAKPAKPARRSRPKK
jgi:hypothetical protein